LDYKTGPVSSIVTQLKYSGAHDIARFLSARYGQKVRRLLPDTEEGWQFGFVPMTSTHQRERGYNQSQLLAECWAGSEKVFTGLKKVTDTSSQVGLTRADRQKNLKGVFALTSRPPEKVIICDDVVTTGSTLGEVTKTLRKGGSKEIWGLVIARD
jgi:ComF family protein